MNHRTHSLVLHVQYKDCKPPVPALVMQIPGTTMLWYTREPGTTGQEDVTRACTTSLCQNSNHLFLLMYDTFNDAGWS